MNIDHLRRQFENPDNRYRFAPFWFLNHDLNVDETRWQVREMNRNGVGGFILHARHGLKTEYLSEEWMANIGAAIDEAKKLNMKAYLYDEDNWPSGPCSARVYADRPEFRMSGVQQTDVFDVGAGLVEREMKIADELIAAVAVPLEDGEPVGFPETARVLGDFIEGDVLAWKSDGEYRVYVFSRKWFTGGRWFGSYVDTLNRDAIARFIELTHAEYAKRFAHEFGATVDGIFTDEPHMRPDTEDQLAWTGNLPQEFEWRTKYALLPILPALFNDLGPETAKFRCDYWATITDLFAKNYMKQLYDYSTAHNLNHIGHLNEDSRLFNGTRCHGDYFQATKYLSWGGCDCLSEQTWYDFYEGDMNPSSNVVACKLASSSAHLMGKPVVMNECFGLASQWAVNLRNLKWMGDFYVALGCTLLEPHAFYYSIQGFRKWECPPGEFYQSAFWPYYKDYADYIGRLCSIFRGGENVADVAMFYPAKTTWAEANPGDNEVMYGVSESFKQLADLLLKLNFDYDIVSEEMIQAADITDGVLGIKLEGGQIARSFKVLAMPATTTISRKTADKLKTFVEAGGNIVSIGELPSKSVEYGEDAYVGQIFAEMFGSDYERSFTVRDAESPVPSANDASANARLYGAPFRSDDELIVKGLGEIFDAMIDADVIITDRDGNRISDMVHLHHRQEDVDFLMVQNTSRDSAYDAIITVRVNGEVSFWDAETGETEPCHVVQGTEDGLVIPLRLLPTESKIICIDTTVQCPSAALIDANLPIVSVEGNVATGITRARGNYSVTVGAHEGKPQVITQNVTVEPNTLIMPDKWQFRTDAPNALPLNEWKYDMRHSVVSRDHSRQMQIYTTTINCAIIPDEARLLLDGLATDWMWQHAPATYNVFVNNKSFSTMTTDAELFIQTGGNTGFVPGKYLDHYIYELDLAGMLQEGDNEIRIETWDMFCEPGALQHPATLVGRFALDEANRIVAEPGEIEVGGWDRQGYPYYSGIGTYTQKFRGDNDHDYDGLVLTLTERPGDLAEIIVNGISSGMRAWEPFEWDITDLVTPRENELSIKIANSMQNLLVSAPRPSGLLGHVRIEPVTKVRFELN